jgi:hypothetical protein
VVSNGCRPRKCTSAVQTGGHVQEWPLGGSGLFSGDEVASNGCKSYFTGIYFFLKSMKLKSPTSCFLSSRRRVVCNKIQYLGWARRMRRQRGGREKKRKRKEKRPRIAPRQQQQQGQTEKERANKPFEITGGCKGEGAAVIFRVILK